MIKKYGIYAAVVLLCVVGCRPRSKAPDVSNIKVAVQSARFDQDLYAIDTNHIGAGLERLRAKYPDFLDFYLDTILSFEIHGHYDDTVRGIREGLRVFLTYKDYVDLADTIKEHFPDTRNIDNSLSNGFRYLKYYFPEYHVPKVIYVDLNLSKLPAFTIDTSILGICLDMFLGVQFPYYRSVGVPNYLAPHLRREYIPVSAFDVIFHSRYPFQTDDRTLLDMIIQRGKEQYFLHHVLPDMPDSTLFGFTSKQMEWCNNNEETIYNFLAPNLYNKEPAQTMGYVNDGPFAQGLEPVTDTVKSTPGNVGSYLGYKIVDAYMQANPKVPLADLLEIKKNPRAILDSANYRPKDR